MVAQSNNGAIRRPLLFQWVSERWTHSTGMETSFVVCEQKRSQVVAIILGPFLVLIALHFVRNRTQKQHCRLFHFI